MSGRYIPNSFQYNGRVATALVPCLVVAAVIGGRLVLATLTIGAMVSYMMDAMQYRDGAFTCSWATLAVTDAAFIYSILWRSDAPVVITVLMIFSMGAVLALTGMWITLQFKWIQLQYPAVALVFERNVLTASLPVAAIMHTLGLATVVDVAEVPYYLAVILGVLYYLLGRPLPSSFQNPKASAPSLGGGSASSQRRSAATAQSKVDAAAMALFAAGMPVLLYMGIHWVVLFKAVHLYSVLLLASVPALAMSLLPQGLWWLPGSPPVNAALQKIVMIAALVVALVGFEGRIIFYAFGQYIKLHPPWNWIAVSLALFGMAAVSLAHHLGALGGMIDITLAGSLLLLCTTAGALAAGVPFQWLPAPLVAACGLALFYDSHSLREYIVFVGGAFLTGAWFVRQHFWFLDITIGPAHLHTLCKLILAAIVPALLVPGLVFAQASPVAIGSLLMLQASLLCVLEERLFVPSHEDFAGEVMYPGYLVIMTSAAGLLTARRLYASGHISNVGSWLLHSLYGAKLAMLLLPEVDLLLPTILLVAASLAPTLFYPGPVELQRRTSGSGIAGGAGGGVGATSASRRAGRVRIAPWQGLLHALSVVAAVGMARFALFDVVQFFLSARPSEGLLLGSLVLALAGALTPLVWRCYSGNQAISRQLAVLAMAGILLVLLQPPLPIKGGARCPNLPLSLCPRLWDERHVPMHEAEDVEIWGTGLGRKEHWPRWLLVAATVMGMGAVAAGGPAIKTVAARIVLGAVAGVLVGGYVALEVVPEQPLLQGLVIVACILVVGFVVLLQLPTKHSPFWLPTLPVAWFVVFGFTALLQAELPVPEPSPEMRRLFPDSGAQVEAEIALATRASLLGVFAAHSLLMAFTLKLKMSSALQQLDKKSTQDGQEDAYHMRRGIHTSDLFCGIVPMQAFSRMGKMLQLEGAAGIALQRLAQENLAWVPTLGNVCTAIAFILAVTLNVYVTGGSAVAIFMMAPLLLLLSQDPVFLPGLGDKQRYFPPMLAASMYLLILSVLQTFQDASSNYGLGQRPFLYAIQNLVLLLLPLPNHWMFLRYLWWQKPGSSVPVLLCAPLSLLTLALSKVTTAQYLAMLAMVMAVMQHFSMRHVRHVSMKVI